MRKLAIITTHPIQYNAPLFRLLAERKNISIKVFYTWGESVMADKFDPGFGKSISWDIPLLEGYEYQFVENISNKPGSHHFRGIQCPGINKQIEKWQPDTLLVYGWSFSAHSSCLRYFKNKIPIFFRGDSTLIDETSSFKSFIKRILLKWVYKHIDFAFYTGQHNRQYFLHYGLRNNQLIESLHVVDNNRFLDPEGIYQQKALEWRVSLGIPNENTVFLFAGKLEPKKDPELLINAFQQLCEIRNDCHLIIVGDGILKDKLVELSKLNLPAGRQATQKTQQLNIVFLPFQNQSIMPIVYRLGDVFVLPSQGPGETWGLAVNEAMACGKPIIVSDKVGCATDLVDSEINGFVFQSQNESDLLNKMEILCNDKALIKKMGEASLNKIAPMNQAYLADIIEKSVLLIGK
jgi:glycosyltransferase involved in cell wall biosynthesis